MKAIDPTKGWYTAQELAGLPGLPTSDRRVREAAEKNLWKSRAKVRGKGLEYAQASLPKATQDHILGLALAATPKPVMVSSDMMPAMTGQAAPTAAATQVTLRGQVRKVKAEASLSDKDRAYRDAALVLCRAVETAMVVADCTVRRACQELGERLVAGQANPDLLAAARATYLKPRKNGGPLGGVDAQVARLQRLMGFFEAGRQAGDVGQYLVAGRREKAGHDPIHVAVFLQYYCVPNCPDVAKVWREGMKPALTAMGLKPPSLSTARKIENSLPVTVKYRGRMTGAAYRALLPYIERDVSMFKANDLWVGDGHSFKAKVQSPLHGNAFTPEVTVVMDWVSRRVVGWSVALSESTIAVSDAFRHAQLRTRARPLIYYSDNGSGQTGKHIDHELTGSLARQGIAHQTGRPGNPQGRGVIERWWPVALIPLAQRYPTFTHKKADKETVRKIGNELARAQRAGEDSPLLPGFRQFLLDLAEAIETYNSTHLHKELGGLTPDEVYTAKLDPDSVGAVSDEEIACLWMPEEIRTPSRGRIELLTNVYHAPVLVHELREGEQVRVRFDIHNADQVWVHRMSGELITVALWDGNKKAAFPVPYVEQKRQERAIGIKGRAQQEVDRADAELLSTYEVQPVPEVSPEALPAEPVPIEQAPAEAPAMSHDEMVMWLYGGKKDGEEGDESFEVAAG